MFSDGKALGIAPNNTFVIVETKGVTVSPI